MAADVKVEPLELFGVRTDVETSGNGPQLLLLHSGDAREFGATFVRRLAEGFTVIQPTHPGFRNAELPGDFVSVDDLAYFYLDLIESLALNDVCMVGASFGGWIAAEIAIRNTQRLSSLVLIDSLGIKLGGREQLDIVDLFGRPAAEVLERSFHDRALAEIDLAACSESEVQASVRNREALAYYGWRPYLHNPSLTRWLHRIDIPTLVIWGEADRIVAPDYGRRYAELIPQASFEVLAQAAHYPHLERPDECAALIRDFARSNGAAKRKASN